MREEHSTPASRPMAPCYGLDWMAWWSDRQLQSSSLSCLGVGGYWVAFGGFCWEEEEEKGRACQQQSINRIYLATIQYSTGCSQYAPSRHIHCFETNNLGAILCRYMRRTVYFANNHYVFHSFAPLVLAISWKVLLLMVLIMVPIWDN